MLVEALSHEGAHLALHNRNFGTIITHLNLCLSGPLNLSFPL